MLYRLALGLCLVVKIINCLELEERPTLCWRVSCPVLRCANVLPPSPGQCCSTCEPLYCLDKTTGRRYSIGQQVPTKDPCASCFCSRSGRIECAYRDCAFPSCPNGATPVREKDQCCPTCPPHQNKCFDKITNRYYRPGQSVPRPKEPCNICSCGRDLKIHCAIRDCAYPRCEGGVEPIVLPGECCPTCPVCDRKRCEIPVCPFNRIPTAKPGDCCPTCPDCRTVKCGFPSCPVGIRPVIKPGECCYSCPEEVDCSAVSCLKPVCPRGVKPITKQGQCCPTCPDCSNVRCLDVVCRKGFAPITRPGSCCPICQQDCSKVFCLQIAICPNGKPPVKLPGQCCPTCLPDCRLVRCAAPVCLGGAAPITPVGQCCPVCPIPRLTESRDE